jgi:hypothetical protein
VIAKRHSVINGTCHQEVAGGDLSLKKLAGHEILSRSYTDYLMLSESLGLWTLSVSKNFK